MSLRVGHLNMLVSLHLVKVSSVRTGIEKIDHLPQAVSSLLIAEARLIHDCLFRECDVSVQSCNCQQQSASTRRVMEETRFNATDPRARVKWLISQSHASNNFARPPMLPDHPYNPVSDKFELNHNTLTRRGLC